MQPQPDTISPGQTLSNPLTGERFTFTNAGRLTRRRLPRNPLELAALARRDDREAHAPLLGVGVQRVLLAPLVSAARHARADTAPAGASGQGAVS